jgi:hypothetical protein
LRLAAAGSRAKISPIISAPFFGGHKDRFINLEGYGYWLRDIACHDAGYDPNNRLPIDYSKKQTTPF